MSFLLRPLPITLTMSKVLSDAMATVDSTTTRVGRMVGMGMLRNNRIPVAPSIFAASMMSSGTALIVAESTVMTKPAWIQTITMIIAMVLTGYLISQFCGVPPSADTLGVCGPLLLLPLPVVLCRVA